MRVVAHLSDLHFGHHDDRVEEALLASLREKHPDLVVVSGDFTQRALKAEFAAARRFLDRIAQPKLVVPGNHDVPLYDLLARLFRPLENYCRYIAPAGVPGARLIEDEIAILGLSTARRFTGTNGRVSHEQMDEIRRVFRPIPQAVMKVLVTHHPLGSAEGHAKVEHAFRSGEALRATAEAGVHLLLSGHHHSSASGEIDAEITFDGHILVIHAGTAISTRLRSAEGNTYNLLRIAPDRVSVSVMECSSEAGFRKTSEAVFLLARDVWRRV